MARGDEQTWTTESLVTAYRERAAPEVADRILEVLGRVQALGRLLTTRTINPAFGFVGNAGRRVMSIREHHANAILGNLTIFPAAERYAVPSDYETLRAQLWPIAMPAAKENPESWDVGSLATISDEEYRHFLGVLDWLGPVPASDAQVTVPSRADTVISRIVRDSVIARRLKQLYDNRCQLCGVQVSGLHGWTYAEAHHVRPLGAPHDGPDVEDNVLILCPNHHAACDFGALELKAADLKFNAGHRVHKDYIRYHNEKIVRRSDARNP